MQRRRISATMVALVLAGFVGFGQTAATLGQQQINPDEAALLLLDGARRGFNEGKFEFAAGQFREFIGKFANHREAKWAQYGLALSLLELPQKDYKAASDSLTLVVADGGFPERRFALYYLGLASRAMGHQALADVAARPAEAAQLRTLANQKFDEAAKHFAAAAEAFAGRIKPTTQPATPLATGQELPPDVDWSTRARCDQAELLLRLGRFKDVSPLSNLLADAAVASSKYRPTIQYLVGYSQFAAKDYLAAGKTLSQLAPFNQEFGPHARYFLARTHHLAGESPEATNQYNAVLADFDAAKKAAQQQLANPAGLTPAKIAFLQSLANGPAPDYLVRATFYSAVLLSEQGKFADAAPRFNAIITQYPKSPQAPEAQLRLGYCQLQARNYPEAAKWLTPLAADPALNDQALWWLGKTQLAAADPANAAAYGPAIAAGMDSLRKAAERSAQLAPTDPAAKLHRADVLMDLADAQQVARQFKEAAATYQAVLTENANPERAEEAMQRQATAYHLAAMYAESEAVCQQFATKFPKSILLGAVAFRSAENAYFKALAAAADPNQAAQVTPLFTDAAARYAKFVKDFPEFAHIALARQALGACQYRLNQFADAAATLAAIPEADRVADLATVSYMQADCLVRLLPDEGDDALAAARLLEQAERAAKLLEIFLGAGPKVPPAQLADATLKLGYCYQRIGSVLADPAERQAKLARAREVYDKALQQFAGQPALPSLVFERAKCIALQGDVNTAVTEMARLQADPLRASPLSPLAGLRQASLLRAMGRSQDAANLLNTVRTQQETVLVKDPTRADWVPALEYEHAVALREANKPAEAKPILEALVKAFPASPFAVSATWRIGQIRRDDLGAALAAAQAAVNRPGIPPAELAAATTALQAAQNDLRQTSASLVAQADEVAKKSPGTTAHLRMLYEAVWCSRVLADAEVEAARFKLRQDALAAVIARISKQLPPGTPAPGLRPPDIALSAVTTQPTEKVVHEQYDKLIVAAGDSSLGAVARYELADLATQRGDYAAAAPLLATALEKNPPADLVEQIRLRLATLLLAQGKLPLALALAQQIGKTPDSPIYGPARLIEAEVRIAQKEWQKAVDLLVPFRDQGPLQTIPNVADRAMLRLGQAYAALNQWDPARQAYQVLMQRFPQSPFVEEAFFATGWSFQVQKQHDNAVANYAEVTKRTASEVAARAQLQSGICRLEQARPAEAVKALLVCALTYDYPLLSAQARCEAARGYMDLKQPPEAIKLWQQVVAEAPDTPWAELAKKRLAETKP
ncbi:MAG: tetratricopeptide repeat protein [Phycisphaerae bacterium]|nr:tetratricopeptide repeat protein [Phycisphaerae bacterium]